LARESRRLIDKMGIADRKNCGGEQHYKALADATDHFTDCRPGVLLF
jgi:hypothetical protein